MTCLCIMIMIVLEDFTHRMHPSRSSSLFSSPSSPRARSTKERKEIFHIVVGRNWYINKSSRHLIKAGDGAPLFFMSLPLARQIEKVAGSSFNFNE